MIRVRDVVKKFDDFIALNKVNCDIEDSSVWGLVGINGAGKSTLLRTMTGIYEADFGTVEYNGISVWNNPDIKAQISFVPDELYLPPLSTMEEMAKKYMLLKRKFNIKKFRELALAFELDTKKRFNTFSKGMRRQAATALAIAEENPYIFFDETFDGLDPFKRNFIKRILKDDTRERGTTVIITSHSLRELEDVCDSLAVLDKGGLVLSKNTDSIKSPAVKVQIAFNEEYDERKFKDFDFLQFTKHGSVATIIIKGEKEAIVSKLKEMSPILIETVPLTLEEIFSYNLEERNILNAKDGAEE